MTTEEAIKHLYNDWFKAPSGRICVDGERAEQFLEAIDMAISALRKPEYFREVTKKMDTMTNADRIRAMSDEELEEFIDRCEMNDIDYAKTFCDLCNGQYECNQCRLDWLKQPTKGE